MSKTATMDECSGRPCIVEYNNKGTGWKPSQFTDKLMRRPMVHDCNCQAGESIISLALAMAQAVIKGDLDREDLPSPHDFRIVYVDEQALDPEVKVVDTSEADAVIGSIRRKA